MLIVPASIGLFGDGFPSTTTTASVIKSALLFDGSSDRLQLKFDEAGNTAEWTASLWIKRGDISTGVVFEARADGNNTGAFYFQNSDIYWQDYDDGVATPAWRLYTDAMFRDPTAWMHVVLVNDTGNGTAGNRQRIYINGTRVTSFSTETNSGQGYESAQGINSANPHYIGFSGSGDYFGGYLAEFIFLDGVATTDAGSFGANDDNGVWVPKDPASTDNIADWGGKNSFWLKFDDGDNIGKNSRPTTVSAVEGSYQINKSMMLDGGADYLIRDPFTAGNRRTFTFSCWLKRSAVSSQGGTTGNNIFGGDRTSSYSDRIMFGSADDGNDWLEASFHDGSSGLVKTHALYRDPTTWMHVLWVVDTTQPVASDRVKIYVNGAEAALNSPSYPAQNYDTNINFTENQVIGARPGNLSHQHFGGYLADAILLDGTAVSDASDFGGWDTNGNWVPIDPATTVAASAGTNGFHLKFDASGLLGKSSISSTNPSVSHLGSSTNGSTSTAYTFSSSSLGAAASNRTIVIAVGGGRATSGTRTVSTLTVGGSSATFIARKNSGAGNVLEFWSIAVASGTSADIVVTFSASMATAGISWWRVLDAGNPISTDGNTASGWTTQAVTTIGQTGDVAFYAIYDEGNADAYAWSDATERSEHIDITSTRSWTSADYTFDAAESHTETATISGGSGNDNGFLGVTFSNNNSFASNSLAAANQVTDSPTNTSGDNEGNYTTFNSIDKSSNMTLTNGNLTVTNTGAAAFHGAIATQRIPNSGKYYFEVTLPGTLSNQYIGVVNEANKWDFVSAVNGSTTAGFYGFYPVNSSSSKVTNGSTSSYGGSIANSSVLGFAIDKDNDEMYVSDDGTFLASSNPATRASPMLSSLPDDLYVAMTAHNSGGHSVTFNFGQTAFAGSVPTGYKRLNTADLAAPTVTDPRAHFANALYTGTAQSKTVRSCFDSTGTAWTPDFVWIKGRSDAGEGVLVDSVRGAANVLTPDNSPVEFQDVKAVTSFIEGGFTLGNGDDRNDSNDNAKTYVAWCLKAGTAWSESAQNSNILASSGSKNDTAKFSIASWTHRTSANYAIKHNLGTTPEFFITKARDEATNWSSWHKDFADTAKRVWINDTDAESTAYWADASDSADGTGSYANISSGESPVTSTLFAVQDGEATGTRAMIAYFFARTPGLIGIGKYTGNTTSHPYVVVDDGASGFRPAWVMIKRVDSAEGWHINDAARDTFNPLDNQLQPNTTGAESGSAYMDFTANGFKLRGTQGATNANTGTYIYLAFADQSFNLARAR